MTKRRGLGRGLSSLIPVEDESSAPEGLVTVHISLIEPNPHQPRGSIEDSGLADLVASIKALGLIQPLIVTTSAVNQYTLIAGERRWRAARLAGLTHVQVIVKEATSLEMLEMALVENIQRADLNPIEEAHAYRQLINDFGQTQSEVASRIGKSRSTVANIVRLLNLPPDIQTAVVQGKISGAHARALLPLPTPEAQTAITKNIIKQDLSVRQVEAIVKKILEGEKPKPLQPTQLSPEHLELESQFRERLGTRVNIQKGAKGGKIIIHFYSDEDLQAIIESIIGDYN
jgi:ParB family chromosome partitioning protein